MTGIRPKNIDEWKKTEIQNWNKTEKISVPGIYLSLGRLGERAPLELCQRYSDVLPGGRYNIVIQIFIC